MTEDEDVYNIGSVVLTIEYNPKFNPFNVTYSVKPQ